jgi:hypothetical protein
METIEETRPSITRKHPSKIAITSRVIPGRKIAARPKSVARIPRTRNDHQYMP